MSMDTGGEMDAPGATPISDETTTPMLQRRDAPLVEHGAGRGLDRSLLRTLCTHAWVVIAASVAAVGVASVYIARTTPKYLSVARLCVEQENPTVMDGAVGVGRRFDRYLTTQATVLTSAPILREALDRLDVRSLGTLCGVDDPITCLKETIRCSAGKQDDIITVSLESPDADQAAKIVNSVVQCYLEFSSKQRRATATELVDVLRAAKQVRDEELRDATARLLEFRRSHGSLLLTHERGGIVTQRMSALARELATAELEAINAQAVFETAQSVRDEPERVVQLLHLLNEHGASPSLQEEEAELAKSLRQAETERTALLETFGPDHPDVTACVARIADARDRLDACRRKLAETFLVGADHRHQMAGARADQLRATYLAQQDLATDANTKAVEYDLLQAEVQRRERISEILDSRIKQIDVTGDVGALNISVLEWAQAGGAPVHPQKARIIGLALILGAILGLIAASIWEWADDRLRTTADISRRLGLPVLGEIPHLADTSMTLGMSSRVPTPLMAEACHTVRTALRFAAQNGRLQTILVASPGAQEGKSTLVSSLAVVLAQAGKRTLIVDANLRNAAQHRIFGLDEEPGLDGLLSSGISFAAAIRPTPVGGLDVLPGGSGPAVSAAELLSSDRFHHLLELLKLEYDCILIDSPPVLDFADASVIAARVDGTLLTVRAARSTGNHALAACATLQRVGAEIVGSVLNDVANHHGRKRTPACEPTPVAAC